MDPFSERALKFSFNAVNYTEAGLEKS